MPHSSAISGIIIAGIATIGLFAGMPAGSHAQNAPVTRGITNADLAETVDQLRALNAELSVRLTDFEVEKDRMAGEIEKLQFQLQQSREQIEALRIGEADLSALIAQLQIDLQQEKDNFRQFQTRLENAFADLEADRQRLDTEQAGDSGDEQDSESVPSVPSVPDIMTDGTQQTSEPATSAISTQMASAGGDQEGLAGGPDLPEGSLGTIPASALPGQAGILFAEAKALLRTSDYKGAEVKFRLFLDQFSADPQAGEALYWLAEVFYQQGLHAEAGRMYTEIIRTHPDNDLAPEALAKLARSMRLVGDTIQACQALDLLPQQYERMSGLAENLAASERVRSGCDD